MWVDDAQSVGWKLHCLGKIYVYKKEKNACGDRLRLMINLRRIDNDVSHKFDLQLFLTVRDISSDGQFDSYFPTLAYKKHEYIYTKMFYDINPLFRLPTLEIQK